MPRTVGRPGSIALQINEAKPDATGGAVRQRDQTETGEPDVVETIGGVNETNPHLPANAPARSYRSVAGGQRQAGPDPPSPNSGLRRTSPLPSMKGEENFLSPLAGRGLR